jgi:hypothetical protein
MKLISLRRDHPNWEAQSTRSSKGLSNWRVSDENLQNS